MRTNLIVWSLGLILGVPLTAQATPAPQKFELKQGEFECASVGCDVPEFGPQVGALIAALQALGVRNVFHSPPAQATGATLVIERGSIGAGRYRILPRQKALVVTAQDTAGVAHAAATLLQLVRVVNGRGEWSGMHVQDAPDQPFRCFMVDMGRNPHDPKTLRQVVDAMWFYKVNYLHLHLSDDQLFSWPSKVFPKLYSERAGWTWDDFVALEAYSQARGVTIIPEIDVPGHSTILRREYPEVFGKTPTDLATREEAQRGVEQLIAELLTVFEATPYFHIGGDEAYGVPAEAQRDFINRLNGFVKSQGRRTIVWEGPRLGEGDNKVATDVIHMNWRTVDFPAQAMLDAGYPVVNAAWDPLYIVDHYPRTMFTAVAVERCYEWDIRRFAHVNHDMPTFKAPHRTATDDGILGFCMPWWEGRPENLLGLCVPRLAAVASAAWNRNGERDFAKFEARQERLRPRLEAILGFEFPKLPVADAASQVGNVAFRAKVTASTGMSQPVFGPQRLTNGLTARFDHFLGFPTQPTPLDIVIELPEAMGVGRIVVHETAVGGSYELYDLAVSVDGTTFTIVATTKKGDRGERSFIEHTFEPRAVKFIKISTRGCHGLTFPSFSRLCEVMAFAR